jgi:hypothetical protein
MICVVSGDGKLLSLQHRYMEAQQIWVPRFHLAKAMREESVEG